jgi:hypothetical protein
MFSATRALLLLAASSVVLSLSAEQAQAQVWFNRPYMGWRGAAWGPYAGQWGGGQIVGTGSFGSAFWQGTYTATQWNQMVQQQVQQTPTFTAAQWNQLVGAQAQLPQVGLLPPRQQRQLNALQMAADQQRQLEELQTALQQLQQLQQKNAQPRRAPADGK